MTLYKTKAKGLKEIITEDEYKALTSGKRMLYDIYTPPAPVRPVALPQRPAGSGYLQHTIPVSHTTNITNNIIVQEEDNSLRDLLFGVVAAEVIEDIIDDQQQPVYVEEPQQPAPFGGFGGGDGGGGGSSGSWGNDAQQPLYNTPDPDEYDVPAQQPDPEPVYNEPDPEPTYDEPDTSSSSDDNNY